MDLANITLHLAGDAGNTIQKFGVTPAEVAVLCVLHGDDAVVDVDIVGEVTRTSRAERSRLLERYGRSHEGRMIAPAVEELFPGAAARVFETFGELELSEDRYKATGRAAPKAAPAEDSDAADDAPVEAPAGKKRSGRPKKATAEEPVAETSEPDIEELDDVLG